MNTKSILLGLACLLLSLPAQAIPPPDAVISIWQSLLQFLGVASVFVGGAILSMRQFFGMYIVGWKRIVFYLSLVVMVLWLLWLLLGGQIAKAKSAYVIEGEQLTINELIKRDDNEWTREWKLKTIVEMQKELNLARKGRDLPKQAFGVVPSFTPKKLHQLLQVHEDQIYLLDIRESFEYLRFGIHANGVARYGDIAGNIIPPNLPKDKVIVVLCHSGLRGYLGASLLETAGYSQVAFLQGGLAAWKNQALPIRGNPDYSAQTRWMPNKKQAMGAKALKIQVDSEGSEPMSGIRGMVNIPYETATTSDLNRVMQRAKDMPILLMCNTYGGCFHSTNMAWWIESKGGSVAGIYDETGEHLKNFFD